MSFTDILNTSIAASWLVLAVAAARLVLKKAPKALHCALWALVAVRLLSPVSIESAMSLIPSREVISSDYLVLEPGDREFDEPAELTIITNPVYEDRVTVEIEPTVDRVQHWDLAATIVWLTGLGAMGIYALYSYLSLRLRVRMAARLRGNIFECDDVASPFILGLFRPRIYLPSDLDDTARAHVLAHENAHLKRLDHIWKPLGFMLLAVHWFNPIMWLGYCLLCRDIELACDERVIKSLDKSAVRAYSEALVRCTVSHRSIALCPLAFGEVGVKDRIKAMTRYKKPGLILTVLALAVSIVIGICFLTDPADPIEETVTGTTAYSLESLLDRELFLSEVLYSHRDKGLPYTPDNAPVYTLTKQDDGTICLQSETKTALYHSFDVLGSLIPSSLSADDFSAHVHGENLLHDLLSGENAAFWQLERESSMTGLHHMLILPKEGGVYLAALEKESNTLRNLYRLTPGEGSPEVRTLAGTYLLDRSADAPYFQLSGTEFILTQSPRDNVRIPGHYEFTDGTLTLRADDGRRFVFHLDAFDQLRFDAQRSDELPVRTDSGEQYLVDGAAFVPAYDGDPENSLSISGLGPGEQVSCEPFTITEENAYVTLMASYVSTIPKLTLRVEDMDGTPIHEATITGAQTVTFNRFHPGQYRIVVTNSSPDRAIDWGTVRFTTSDHTCEILGSEIRDQEDHKLYETALDKAITRAILDQSATAHAGDRICVASFRIMDQEELCMDGDPGAMVTTLYLLPRYQEYSWANNVLRLEYDHCTPTILELTESGGSYTLKQYRTMEKESDIAEHFTWKARDFLTWVEESTRENLADECKKLAQLRLDAGDLPEPEAIATIRNYRLEGTDSLVGPSFALCSDGTFSFSENPLSSYLGTGIYTLSDHELILRTDDGRKTWVFTPDGTGFRYKAEESSIISYYPDLKNSIRLPDGAKFTETEHHAVGTDALGEAIAQAILDHYEPTVKGSARIQAHEILDSESICGVAPAGGNGSNQELMVIYALTRYEEYLNNDILTQECIPAVLTFQVTADGYALRSYETPRKGEYYQSDLEKLLSKAALTRLKKEEYDLIWKLADDCAYQNTNISIAAQEAQQKALNEKLETLLAAICSSPAQSSNPGDYVSAHPTEMQQAREAGFDALRWCFTRFAEGGQIGLEGHIMALLCQEIILESGESCQTEGYMTGQDWFNTFAREAERLKEELGSGLLLYEAHPCHAMALEALGIL